MKANQIASLCILDQFQLHAVVMSDSASLKLVNEINTENWVLSNDVGKKNIEQNKLLTTVNNTAGISIHMAKGKAIM